ncbi:histidinol dehydrogenase [Leptospira ryugenii]|uniref:Histidinol dehydrogenase n=1 Tax=Leptospira ryugenii TaxID=1917863 RepID=A0A2P2DX54_9LEPT|nr:histidinol dehydrogenase [Leptospira ryugenii]GBF49213.1 histidinol dehydrogenase [Leptospira ryugenii]
MSIPIILTNRVDSSLYRKYLKSAKSDLKDATEKILPILRSVETEGDLALRRFTETFDGIQLESIVWNPMDVQVHIDPDIEKAFLKAKENIESFHRAQLRKDWSIQVDGNRLGVKHSPIPSLSVYAPGGTALYPSSVLMGVIPAIIAGVPEIQLVTPPQKEGLPPILVWLAKILGIKRIITVGGAQGIAACAYGTESVPKSEFVVGPGNTYVAAAKSYLAGLGLIGIDSPAGPSEVCIIADESANPMWLACDMLSQAEHGEDSSAILLTDSEALAKEVSRELEKAFEERPKRLAMKKKAIYENSAILVMPNIEECISFSNELAPEHLEIQTKNPEQVFAGILHAGSVFLGPYSPVAMGDYISGTNHILPTARGSRIYSSLGVDTFLKRVTFQEISRESLSRLYPYVKTMSELEGLDEEHGTSVKVRTEGHQH